MPPRALCADLSRQNAEPLEGTASRIDHWLLVEYRGLWARDVLAESGLSEGLKQHLRAQLALLPRARLLFIRRPERRRDSGLNVYFGSSPERGQRFFHVTVDSYDELRELDFAAALRREGSPPGRPVNNPLFVVCTHGKRDRCCAVYGRPLYDALRDLLEPDRLWQSSHVGGDRFAGNLVCLPEGIYFGRVGAEDAGPLLSTYLAGELDVACFRGRACYSFPAQAAERRVRAESGLLGIADLVLRSEERLGDGFWRISFLAEPSGEVHEVEVETRRGELTYLTCDAASLARPRQFVTRAHRVLPARR